MYIIYIYTYRMDQRYGTEVWNGSFKHVWNGGMERRVWNGWGPGPCSGPYNLTCTHIYLPSYLFTYLPIYLSIYQSI